VNGVLPRAAIRFVSEGMQLNWNSDAKQLHSLSVRQSSLIVVSGGSHENQQARIHRFLVHGFADKSKNRRTALYVLAAWAHTQSVVREGCVNHSLAGFEE
jgi:hypothetical protein